MELLRLEGLEGARGDRELFRGADLVLRSGDRLGLVAPNGHGKSTLLAFLAGERPPGAVLAGTVRRAPGVRVSRVAQDAHERAAGTVADAVAAALAPVREAEAALREEERRLGDPATRDLERYAERLERFEALGGWQAEARAWASLERLGIAPTAGDRPLASLTPGERARLALAAALAVPSDVLLVDEPTAHLGLDERRRLEALLADLPDDRALVVASHDRAHLDAVTTATVLLRDGRLERRTGSVSEVRRRLDATAASRERRARAARTRAAREGRTAALLRSHGHAGAQVRRKRLERSIDAALAQAAQLESSASQGSSMALATTAGEGTTPGRLRARHLSRLGRFDDLRLDLEPGARVALFAGDADARSELLAMLAGETDSDDPRAQVRYGRGTRVAWLDARRRALRPDAPVLAQVERSLGAQRAREQLARAGLAPSRWSAAPEALSGGERTRAALALLLAGEPTLLLLDEPDAGLDIDALESLEDLLLEHPATLVLATHDRALAAAVTDEVVALEDEGLVPYRGGVEGFLAGRRRREPGTRDDGAPVVEAGTPSGGTTGAARAGTSADGADRPDPPGRDPVEALEGALADVDDALLDPFAHSERERARLERRRRELVDALSVAYGAALPAAEPRLAVRIAGRRWTLHGGPDDDANAEPAAAATSGDDPRRPGEAVGELRVVAVHDPGQAPHLEVRIVADVAHLRPQPPPRSELTRWGRRWVVEAAVLLLDDTVAPRAIQVHAPDLDLTDVDGFASAPGGWWVREARRVDAGRGDERTPRRRRLVTASRWGPWTAARRHRSRRD